MKAPDDVQAAIIAHLKADTALVAWLTARSAQNEIRENQWQGTDFTYPAVRVDLLPQLENGNPPCFSQQLFNVYGFIEGNSSLEGGDLIELIDAALIRKNIVNSTYGITTGLIISLGTIAPIRTAERVWQATGQYQTNLYGAL